MGRLGKSPIDESGVYSGPKSPEISSVGQGLHPAPQGRTQRHTGANAESYAPCSPAAGTKSIPNRSARSFALCCATLRSSSSI